METRIYDLEIYRCLTLCCLEVYETGERKAFEVSWRKNELDGMVAFLNSRPEDGIAWHVAYNNLSYDGQVLQYIHTNYQKWHDKTGEEICSLVYQFSTDLIDSQNYDGYRLPFWESEFSNYEIDLMSIHHYNGEQRRVSLKWLEFSMDQDMEELPIYHGKTSLTSQEIDDVILYCWNDINATKALYEITRGNTSLKLYKGQDKIQDRLDLMNEEILTKCINYSDVKLGDELNKNGYCREARIDKKKLYDLKRNRKPTKSFTFGQCIPKYVSFTTPKFQAFHKSVAKEIVKLRAAKNKKEGQFFYLEHNGTSYTIARGGIHSNEKARIIVKQEGMLLKDADIGLKIRLWPNQKFLN